MWNIILRLLSDPIHLYLLTGDVLATIAVGVGIIWEHGPPEVKKVANRLVIGGVIVETLCSILLFVYDENISAEQQSIIRAQNDKIIALETRLVDLLEPRTLTQEQKDRIVQAIRPFSSVSFVVMTAPEEEPWELVLEISKTLKDNSWKWEPFPEGAGHLVWQSMDPTLPPEGMTISNRFVLVVPPSLKDVADALSGALTDPSIIGMEKVPVVVNPDATRMNIIAGTKR